MLLLIPSIQSSPIFPYPLVPSAFHSSILFISAISFPILFKYPKYLKHLTHYLSNVVLNINNLSNYQLIIFSFLNSLAALRQKSISIANNLSAWCLPNAQVSALYNITFSTNDLEKKVLVLFNKLLLHKTEINTFVRNIG